MPRIVRLGLLVVSMLLASSHMILAYEGAAVVVHRQSREIKPVTFIDASGRQLSLADYNGKAVLLNYWATWCPPCVKEMPALSELQKKYGAAGLAVVTISQDWNGDLAKTSAKVSRFFSLNRIDNLPAYLDDNSESSDHLGIESLPTTIIIDRNGRERGRVEGLLNTEDVDFQKLLTSIMGG